MKALTRLWLKGLCCGNSPSAQFLNLALVFGAAVIWARGFVGGTDLFAIAMSAAAFVALYRFKADVLWVVIAGGVIGLLWTLLLG